MTEFGAVFPSGTVYGCKVIRHRELDCSTFCTEVEQLALSGVTKQGLAVLLIRIRKILKKRGFVMLGKAILIGCAAVIAVAGLETRVTAQDAASLAASLDKNKHKKKEKSKHGINISIETYVDIKNVPALRESTAYSGRYSDGDSGNMLDLRVAADGTAEGTGVEKLGGPEDGQSRRNYTLRGARVAGAVLTGERVFADGRTDRLEAVFVNRTIKVGVNVDKIEESETHFGLGYVQSGNNWTSRVFMMPR